MKCPHCTIEFHDSWDSAAMFHRRADWHAGVTTCPACDNDIIEIWNDQIQLPRTRAYPFHAARVPVHSAVPADLKVDYEEACGVLAISPKASAALSRRCLQGILRQRGYNQRDLVKQITAALEETDATKALPISINDNIDAIRNFGNFSAHPMDDKTTLQIIDVDPEEAEWCLELIEELFEFAYVSPFRAAERKAALNQKLTSAGKPPAL